MFAIKTHLQFLLIMLGIAFVCSCSVLSNRKSELLPIKMICADRHLAINRQIVEEPRIEYKKLKKYCMPVLKELINKLAKSDLTFNKDSQINIVDNYILEQNHHGGVIWSDTTYILYRYNFVSKRIDYFKILNGLSNYPSNADIHISLVRFLSTIKSVQDFNYMPVSGRTNNGYCVFSQIKSTSKNQIIKSFAFRQW